MDSEKINLKGLTLDGFTRELQRGGSIWVAQVPAGSGGGFVFLFTAPDGEKTHLALSQEAFDALAHLHDLLVNPRPQPYRILVECLDKLKEGGDWYVAHPKRDAEPTEPQP